MKVTILGTANAWGVNELAGASWPMKGVLSDGRTTVEFRRYRTSLLVETRDGKRILVDCGPDFAHQRREFKVGIPDAILITHPHFDHIGGLDDLNVYRLPGGLPIPVYAHPDCWTAIKHTKGFGYLVEPLGLVSEEHLRPFEDFSIGSVTVTPFPVEHSPHAPGAVGYAFAEQKGNEVKRVLYTGDLWAVSDPTHPLFANAFDVLIMECDRWQGLAGPSVGGGHMSFQEAVRWLTSGVFSDPKPKQVVFVHFGDNGPRGVATTYADWRSSIVDGLRRNGLACVMPNEDLVVGYEGLTFSV
jgi:phosphoribosyl 1,2-cyclic phosphodiesterase